MIAVRSGLARLAVWSGMCCMVVPLVSGQTGAGAPATGSIEGRVVLVGTNQPVPEVDIFVFADPPVAPVKTDASGRFRFERLAAGRYGLMLSPMSGYRAREMPVTVREDQKVTSVEIKAYAGAVISGRVRDAKDRPVAGLLVSALRLDGGGARFPPDRGMAAPTNDAGEYKLTGLNPGRYALFVETKRPAVFSEGVERR